MFFSQIKTTQIKHPQKQPNKSRKFPSFCAKTKEDVLWEQSMHAMHMPNFGGGVDWVWGFQE